MIPGLTLIEDQVSLYNARRSGAEYNAATLLSAIDDIGTIEMVLYISKELEGLQSFTIWEIDQNITFPSNINVHIPCGVVLNVHAGITVTFNAECLNQCALWHTGPGVVITNARTAINTLSYRDFFNPFVVSGGLHGLSPTCYSEPFATNAYGGDGQFITADNIGGMLSIHYGNMGANCLDDTVWVVISSELGDTIPGSNFIRVPGSNYFIDYVSSPLAGTQPPLPRNSAYLMEVQLFNDQIVRVNDLRTLTSSQAMLERVPLMQFLPVLYPGIFTYGNRYGFYITVGKIVFIYGLIEAHMTAPGPFGHIIIQGLPFPCGIFSGITFHVAEGVEPSAGFANYSGNMSFNTGEIYLVEKVTSRPASFVTSDRLLADSSFMFTGMYITEQPGA